LNHIVDKFYLVNMISILTTMTYLHEHHYSKEHYT